MRSFLKIFFSLIFLSLNAAAASQNSLKPEVLSAKALLEDLLVRRFSQELSVQVKKESFNLGAQLELVDISKAPPTATTSESEPISGLMLGKLDPEELLKKYGDPDSAVQNFLNNYKIKSVNVSVGLSEGLGDPVKADVEKWLTSRLQTEFGKAGKGTVTFTKIPLSNPEHKNLTDWLSQFQALAGQLVLGFLILLAVLLWKTGSKPIQVSLSGPNDLPTLKAALQGDTKNTGASTATAIDGAGATLSNSDSAHYKEEVINLSSRLREIAKKATKDMESVMRSWCQMGDTGKMRLACFAEAVGTEIGKLPIPVDAISDITRIFSTMATLGPKEKKETLQKAYWDLLSVVNLGPESLEQPFGYLGRMNLGLMKEVLLEQNTKMQTLVSMYMPSDLRSKYVRSLPAETKMELLRNAAQLSEVKIDDLKNLDTQIRSRFQPQTSTGTIALDMTLKKLVEVLSPVEQITMLPQVQEPSMVEFKKTVPTLAFIHEWPDEKLRQLVRSADADQVVAYLSTHPELNDRIINLCPPLTAELVKDEMQKIHLLNEKDKNQRLESFAKLLESLVKSKEIQLDEIFTETKTTDNVTPIKVA